MIRKDVDIMRDSEYIAWKSETRTQIEKTSELDKGTGSGVS